MKIRYTRDTLTNRVIGLGTVAETFSEECMLTSLTSAYLADEAMITIECRGQEPQIFHFKEQVSDNEQSEQD